MKNTPIERNVIDETINEFQIVDFSKATIREVKAIASKAEAVSGVEFIKMEMGVPGLPASAVGVKAEIEALQNGIASLYPDINGLPELKKEASDFIKAFINVDLSPEGCVPVTGSMQGTFASFLTCSQCDEKKDTILFIDPGFPVQKQQLVVMGQKYETFDVYDYRGDKLKEKLEKSEAAVGEMTQELADLREIVFNQQSGTEEKAAEVKITFPYHTTRRILAFGGHDSWLREIKFKVPDVRFMGEDISSPEIIRRADVVWIQTNCIGHKSYYNIIDLARRYDRKVRYFKYASASKCAEQIVEEENADE